MQLVLLFYVCLVRLGLSGASIGRNFLMMFPPHNDPTAGHQVTIRAASVWTSVTIKVLQSDFTENVSLNATESQTILLPSSVGMASARSSSLLSISSVQPVTVLAALCTRTGCVHSLLHDVSSWGTHYYPVTPNIPTLTSVSEIVVTNSNRETSVEIFPSVEVVFNGSLYSEGQALKLHLGSFESVYLQSNFSLSGSEIYAQEAVGVMVGFTCVNHLLGDCLYGFAELKPVTLWSYEYFVPPLINAGMSPSLLLAMSNINANMRVTTSMDKKSVSVSGGVMKTITVLAIDEVHVISDVPLQLIYYRHDLEQRASTLTALLSVDDICLSGPMSDSKNITPLDVTFHSRNLTKYTVNFLHETNDMVSRSINADVGHYLSTMNRESHPSLCEKNISSCDDLHCGHKKQCTLRNGTPLCTVKTQICSAWDDSYYRTFGGKDFVLLGNCNYTLVQTACPDISASTPLQVNIARAYLNGATISSINNVEIKIDGFNISMVKGELNQIRVNGHKKYLPIILRNGTLRIYPSGLGVVLDTSVGLKLQYDWSHNILVEAGPELQGLLCGLCGNANKTTSGDTIAWNGTNMPETTDFTLPWVLDSNTDSCMEDCSTGQCQVCNSTQSYPGPEGNSTENKCTLLKHKYGAFSDCHLYIDPEPFVRSCDDNLCLSGAMSSVCKVFAAYASICQRLGGRIRHWRAVTKCYLACPINSHYEVCGSACQPTCGNPEAHLNCSLPCLESCQCNRGYLLSNGKCVLPSECGCIQNGSYYLPSKTFWMDGQCQQKCVCQPYIKTVMCIQSHCHAGEICKVLNGVHGCHTDQPGLCVAKGESHYTTFDGQKFEVHGNCSYLLASHCPTWGYRQDFSIEVQNPGKKAANVSFWHVKMSVAGYFIEMSYEWYSKVKVNGLLLNLPSVLGQGKIMLYLKGQSNCIETEFGVIVTYSPHILTVTMPKVYAGSLCGLCGNFNDKPQDDLVTDDFDITQAIRHWRTSKKHECWDVPMTTSGCHLHDKDVYQRKNFCGILIDQKGPFQNCHETVDPQEFYDDCVHDFCNWDWTTQCQVLSSYVAVCQEMGALLDDWRNSSFCSVTCPSNSEYHLCSSHMLACAQNPSPPSVRCKEGCFCKPGFFHSGGECVQISECGCSFNGIYYKLEENFHPDENCFRMCVCVGHNKVQCQMHTCPAGTKCVVKQGRRACHASHMKCTIMGGRHLQTFQGHRFNVNLGNLHHLLLQLCDEPGLSAAIHRGQLHLRINDMNMILPIEYTGRIEVDGVLKTLPLYMNGVAVLFFGSLMHIAADNGTIVTFGGPKLIQMTIPATYKRLCGLCQNAATGDQGGLMSDNSMHNSSLCFSPTGTNCSIGCHDCVLCNGTKEFKSDDFCGMLLAPGGSFGSCHSIVDPMPYFQNCMKGLCRSNNTDVFCDSLRQYTFACQDAGAEVKPWRGQKCELPCSGHSHYNVCVRACSESCTTLSDVPCPSHCYEGCQCDSGYVQSGNGCVRPEQCGCFYLGQYYEVGEDLWNVNCSKQCNCCSTATLCCRAASCLKWQNCEFNGTWHCGEKTMVCPVNSHYEPCGTACPPTCVANFNSSCNLSCVEGCQCDPGFLLDGDTCVNKSQCGCTYNGDRYHSNKTFWADESCTRQCRCDPYTRQVQCHEAYCDSDEYCDLQNGIRTCVQHNYKMCRYSGNRLLTFDHREYNFLGACQYQLLGICQQWQGLDVIKIDVLTDAYNQLAQNVLVSINDQFVKLDLKNLESIEVNGTKRSLPFYINETVVLSLGLHTYLYSDFGFLSISKEGIIVISLFSKYANATCGLCGNFNSDPSDDLSVNGTHEHLTPEQFGKAWRSGQNHSCYEGCLGGSCPNCSSDTLAPLSDPAGCGKILEVNGPFKHCHSKVDPSSFYKSCIGGLCLYGDVRLAVCHSLAEYADVCLHHKALVDAWRSPEFCDDSCHSSTIYSMSKSPVEICLGFRNLTVKIPAVGENCLCGAGLVLSGSNCVLPANCGCLHGDGRYVLPGQELSTCEQKCSCHPGGNLSCVDVSCSLNEECTIIGGIQGCHPKTEMDRCSVNGSQFNTFDGQAFEFHGSYNYTLIDTCALVDQHVEPLLITVIGSDHSEGKQIDLQVYNMTLKMSSAYPQKIQVNEVYEHLPFLGVNVTVHQENGRMTLKTANLVVIISDLYNYIEVKLPITYHRTTCGLCGNNNDESTDDMQLPNGTVVSDPDVFRQSWMLSGSESCRETANSTCQPCQSPLPEYSSDLYCGVVTQPNGPFSSCHTVTCPEKYYTMCLNNLCGAKGHKQALCGPLELYEAACKVAGVAVDPWRNITGCAQKCPQFSHFSPCANICTSYCSEISFAAQCPTHCEEGCQCDDQYFYDGHACVPAEQCGCIYEGTRVKVSERKLLQNCTLNCTCGPPLTCEEHKCPPLHSCMILNGVTNCHNDSQDQNSCDGKCEKSQYCHLRNGVAVCENRSGLCWTWGNQYYRTFDGFNYNVKGTCTYLLSGSKGAPGGATPFMVSKKSDCEMSSRQLVTVHAYGFVLTFADKDSVHVNGQVNYIPVTLLRGKIEVSNKEDKTLLETDFGLHVLFDWNTTLITLHPNYKDVVYGLCGNFNDDPQDDFAINLHGMPPVKTSVELAQSFHIFDGDLSCCTGCKKSNLENATLLEDGPAGIITTQIGHCNDLIDPTGPFAHCHIHVDPHSFYQSCRADLIQGMLEVAFEQAATSYTAVCKEMSSDFPPDLTIVGGCPPNSHYTTCGSACPQTCFENPILCILVCVQGCFCNPGFVQSPEGCVPPNQCGCADSRGKYHRLNSVFWIPDDCGQLCTCKPGETKCNPSGCPKGMSCKQLPNKRMCQAVDPQNCTIVNGLHFTSFDGNHFDFRDNCEYVLVETNKNLNGLEPFYITIADASCHKRLFHSLTLKLSIYSSEVVLSKEDPDKLLVNGLHKPLPYAHHTGHFNAYHTPSSLVIHVDMGLQVIVYKSGTVMVVLPSSYASSVHGLCGNANFDPYDDQIMPDGEEAQSTLEFAHSWMFGGARACSSRCTARPKNCPRDSWKLYGGSHFCGILKDELGPFAECALGLSPKSYFHNCLTDTCFYGGHYFATCSSIAAYVAACQAAQLVVRNWRSDTFCGMTCPKNSHYELCGPRCPAVCPGLSSATNCGGGCEEGCQCDRGYVLSNGHCVQEADCGCLYDGKHYPAGYFSDLKTCQFCYCYKAKVSCRPSPCRPEEGLSSSDHLFDSRPWQYATCEIFGGFGFVTFDGLVLPHYGACTYLVSERSPKDIHGHSLLLSFEKNNESTFVSKIIFVIALVEIRINLQTPWKIQVNGEDFMVPYTNDILKAFEDGGRLTITSVTGVRLDLSFTKYIRLSIPQDYNRSASGLCGNFNRDKSDDLELRSGYHAQSIADFFHSWSIVAPGQNCSDTCGVYCGQCKLSLKAKTMCDILTTSIEFNHCSSWGVKPEVYRDVCLRAICGGVAYFEAVCLALEAYSAACQAAGITIRSWRENGTCSFKCLNGSSPSQCVDYNSNSCPALLQPSSSAAGCSGGCQCQNGNLFDGSECVPVSQCGCVVRGRYIKMDEHLYSKDCTERCWCHPQAGALCEKTACSTGQFCSLKNGSWRCVGQEVCQLKDSLQLSTFNGQQLSLAPKTPYQLIGLCNKTTPEWFSLISYNGPCDRSSTRPVTVFQIFLVGFSIVIQNGIVKVNGHLVPLPHVLPSGLTLSSSVAQDESEVVVVLKKDPGLESEMEMEIGITMVTLNATSWYSGKLCGICGNLSDPHSHTLVKSWAVSHFQGWLPNSRKWQC
ncbi:IgGFc-binding protein isoform X2 [Corythoichthys intestinalis]|uniref:IgGFc-binding protein isoform X2 n=1 Tax=Corythoichthys intestinalis TaxID=161448 RepID=UPI0025A68886|nr:IgGFc-binding protein isoform X2 [Corythoichthys intestinalis]